MASQGSMCLHRLVSASRKFVATQWRKSLASALTCVITLTTGYYFDWNFPQPDRKTNIIVYQAIPQLPVNNTSKITYTESAILQNKTNRIGKNIVVGVVAPPDCSLSNFQRTVEPTSRLLLVHPHEIPFQPEYPLSPFRAKKLQLDEIGPYEVVTVTYTVECDSLPRNLKLDISLSSLSSPSPENCTPHSMNWLNTPIPVGDGPVAPLTITTGSIAWNPPVERSFDHYFGHHGAVLYATNDAMFSVATVSGYPTVRLSGEPTNATASMAILNYGDPNNSGGTEWLFAANGLVPANTSPFGYSIDTTKAAVTGPVTIYGWAIDNTAIDAGSVPPSLVQENRSLDHIFGNFATAAWSMFLPTPVNEPPAVSLFGGGANASVGIAILNYGRQNGFGDAGWWSAANGLWLANTSPRGYGGTTAAGAWTVYPYRNSQGGCPQFTAGGEPRLTWKVLNSGGVHLVVTPLRPVPSRANRPSTLPPMRHPQKPRWLRTVAFTSFPGG